MIACCDTSALAKVLVEERESPAVREFLADTSRQGVEWLVSTMAVTELRRLAIRLDIEAHHVEAVITPFRVVRLTDGILHLASRLPHRHLGTLDAIHISTALAAGAEVLMTFDLRQADAARQEGLSVVEPGR